MDFIEDTGILFSNFVPTKLEEIKEEVLSHWQDAVKIKTDGELNGLIREICSGDEIDYEDFFSIIYNIKKIESIAKAEGYSLETLLAKIRIGQNEKREITKNFFTDVYEIFLSHYKEEGIIIQIKRIIKKYKILELEYSNKKTDIYEKYDLSNKPFLYWLLEEIVSGLINGDIEKKLKYYEFDIEKPIFQNISKRIVYSIDYYLNIPNDNISKSLAKFLKIVMKSIDKTRVFKDILNFYICKESFEEVIDSFEKVIIEAKFLEKYVRDLMDVIIDELGEPEKNLENWIVFSKEEQEFAQKCFESYENEDIFRELGF